MQNEITIWDKILLWWRYSVRYYPWNFVNGIKNLWSWFLIIWKDRNWDHFYIYAILEHKLKKQANCIEERNISTDTLRNVRNIRIVANLISRVKDDFYGSEYYDYEESDLVFTHMEGIKFSEMKFVFISEHYADYFKKYPLIYKRVLAGEGVFSLENRDDDKLKYYIAMNIAQINQQRAQRLLFKILNEQINSWWD